MRPRRKITSSNGHARRPIRSATVADLLGGFSSRASKPARINPRWRRHYRHLLELRDQLLGERAELARESSAEAISYSMHMADAATDTFDRDFALGLLSANQDALYEIEQAIKRI